MSVRYRSLDPTWIGFALLAAGVTVVAGILLFGGGREPKLEAIPKAPVFFGHSDAKWASVAELHGDLRPGKKLGETCGAELRPPFLIDAMLANGQDASCHIQAALRYVERGPETRVGGPMLRVEPPKAEEAGIEVAPDVEDEP